MNEKKQSTDSHTKMNQWLELSDKGCKSAIRKMLQQPIGNPLEKNKK